MEQTNLEQPAPEDAVKVNEPIMESKEDAIESGEGSNLGKFKDATSLYQAYQALEKEFTRKSQKLSMLSKQIMEEKTQNEEQNTEKTAQNAQNEQNIHDLAKEDNLVKPLYLRPDWQKKVSSFVLEHPGSQAFLKQMSTILINDKELSQSENCLDIAYRLATFDTFRPAMLNDPKNIDFLKADERIKDAVLKDYLLSLKSQPKIRFISGEANATMLTPTQSKPKNLKEASNMVKKLLEL